MKFTIDTEQQTLQLEEKQIPLYSQEAFALLSEYWLKLGWNARYHYTFSWLGRPILQLPEDIVRLQEVLFDLKPDVIIETGVALGGSLLFYASMCALNGKGRVIGIDIDLRPHNRKALEQHSLAPYLTLIDGSSIELSTFSQVQAQIKPSDKVMVVLDSNHSKQHVLKELVLYAPLVSLHSFLLVTDGFKQSLSDVPRGKKMWAEDHPIAAVKEFLGHHPEFVLEYPERLYNRSSIRENVTHFTEGWLRRVTWE